MEEKDIEKLMELLTTLNVLEYRYRFQTVIDGPPAISEYRLSQSLLLKPYQLLSIENTVKRLREAVKAVEPALAEAKAFLEVHSG